jgi:hypothetical protein
MATVLYEYAAKFICGVQKDREDLRLTPGVYGTEINVHNPNDHTVRFRKKLALTFPPGEQRPGEILRFPEEDYLRPDQALAVDCNHVRAKLFGGSFPAPGYITGFIVIESTASLDVTAVYTTAALNRARLSTSVASMSSRSTNARSQASQSYQISSPSPTRPARSAARRTARCS